MKNASIVLIFLISIQIVAAQAAIRNTGASKNFDVGVEVRDDDCSKVIPYDCSAIYSFFRKRAKTPFQTVLIRTQMSASASADGIEFGDFNFDGHQDVAVTNGMNSAYTTPSYVVFLYSKRLGRFVKDASFTRLATGESTGFFQVNKRETTLTREGHVGCCYFWTETYDIHADRPRLIYKRVDDASNTQEWAIITTKKLVHGKWRTWIKRTKTSEYYK